MTIEEDIDFHIESYKDSSEQEKSDFAYSILVRFDQVKNSIIRSEENIESFDRYSFIPPVLRKIVVKYSSGDIDKDHVIQLIDQTKKIAGEYLMQKGFNPELARKEEQQEVSRTKEYFDKIEREQEKVFSSLEKLTEKIEKEAKKD